MMLHSSHTACTPPARSLHLPEPATGTIPVSPAARRVILDTLHIIVLVLSVLLITVISYTTFKSIPFLKDPLYMRFQLVVCLVFIIDFFMELWLTPRGERHLYMRSRWLYLLLSVPYLNIIDSYSLSLSSEALYFIRFVPLCRGGLALVIVLDYISSNRITGMFLSYLSILALTIYFAALIFYECEQPVNPGVTSYWDAIWWCCMQSTTLGCSLMPVTAAGKVLSFVLSLMGMIMFPLFTVYLSSLILRQRSGLNNVKFAPATVKSAASHSVAALSQAPDVAPHDKI